MALVSSWLGELGSIPVVAGGFTVTAVEGVVAYCCSRGASVSTDSPLVSSKEAVDLHDVSISQEHLYQYSKRQVHSGQSQHQVSMYSFPVVTSKHCITNHKMSLHGPQHPYPQNVALQTQHWVVKRPNVCAERG